MIALLLVCQLQTDMFTQENVLQFADYLYEQKDFAAALAEYRRYQFLSTVTDEIREKIVECLVQLQRFNDALKEAALFASQENSDYAMGRIYFYAGKYDSSRIVLGRVGTPYKEDAAKLIGLGYAFQFKFSEADAYIALPDAYPRYKKPLIGALCALIPGGGHLYCGRTGDAIFTFLVVSTSALLSYYYYDRDEKTKFGIVAGATALLWAGNLYGGINAVRNYNYYQNKKYLERIVQGLHK